MDQKMLFSVDEIKKATRVKTNKMRVRLCKAEMTLAEAFPTIEQGYDYPYVSGSDWGMHDFIIHILGIVGPCDLWAASWAVSTTAAQKLVDLMERGLLKDVVFLVDWRVGVHTPDFLAVAKSELARVAVTGVHAKVFVLINEQWSVSVVGSQNYTENPRIEAGHLSTAPEIAVFHKNWILAEMDRAQPFGRDMKKASKTKW